MFKLKNIQLITEVDSSADIKIKADYKRIMQVLINLITNALKCTD